MAYAHNSRTATACSRPTLHETTETMHYHTLSAGCEDTIQTVASYEGDYVHTPKARRLRELTSNVSVHLMRGRRAAEAVLQVHVAATEHQVVERHGQREEVGRARCSLWRSG